MSAVPSDVPESEMNPQLTTADNAFFLGLYRCAVDFYQPRIEKRTGVPLGKISVWDYEQLHRHVMRDFERSLGWLRRLTQRRRLHRFSQSLKTTYAERAKESGAFYFRSAIYVSFLSRTAHDFFVAEAVVHELSHALWEKIEGVPLEKKFCRPKSLPEAEQERFKLLVEGYAVYAQRVWFHDLYPARIRKYLSPAPWAGDGIYFQGFKRIREIVENSGPEVLMEIPKRWRDF